MKFLLSPNLYLYLFFLGINISPLFAQNVALNGIIKDSVQNPISYANVIASPIGVDSSIKFAISDEQGRYKMDLISDITYELEITHLGYSKGIDTLSISESTSRNFTLIKSTESLEAVLVEHQMAVIVKEDTITYRVGYSGSICATHFGLICARHFGPNCATYSGSICATLKDQVKSILSANDKIWPTNLIQWT